MDAAALIEEAIAYETAEMQAAPAEDHHFWDGWSEDAVRQGMPVVRVFTAAPGLGKTTRAAYHLVIEAPDGEMLATVREARSESFPTAWTRRAGREAYVTGRARSFFGDLPVRVTHHV